MQIWIVIVISKDLQQSFLSETLNFQSDLANNEKLSLHKNKQIISKQIKNRMKISSHGDQTAWIISNTHAQLNDHYQSVDWASRV